MGDFFYGFCFVLVALEVWGGGEGWEEILSGRSGEEM